MEDKPINETYLKLSSKVPYPGNLFLGQDITVTISNDEINKHYIFNVVKEEINDLQNGEVNKTFIAKCLLE